MKVGLIGLGYWGKNILRVLRNLQVLKIACDSNPLNEVKGVPFTTDYRKVLESDVDGVCIATPAITHFEFASKCILANKDVFIEKPLATTVTQARELQKLAEEHNRILMVGHVLQYHPAITRLKILDLGDIEYIYSRRLNMGKLRLEENILWSFAPHDISVILSLIEKPLVNVECFGAAYINKGIYDTTLTSLDFGSIKAHVFVSWLHPFKEQKLVVIGSKAMAVFDDLSEDKLTVYEHRIQKTVPRIDNVRKYSIPILKVEPLEEELKHFIACMQTRSRPRTNGEEAINVLKVIEEAERKLNGPN